MTGSRTISRTSDTAPSPVLQVDCIVVSYPGCSFLINRAQIAGSYYDGYRDASKIGKGPLRLIDIDNRIFPLINFDDFIARCFHIPITKQAEMIIFARGDSPNAPKLPRIKKKSTEEAIDTGTIAVQLSGKTGLAQVPLKDLRLLPSGLFPYLSSRGLLGVRFPADGSIEYLIDIQTVIATNIARTTRKEVCDENHDC
ncbi:MAG: hypothetical protein KA369_20365 [Spirochaetes bacterium]|nr:hypothetical protein [Spirochaetota bacterium]